jgi:hypothetical protein
VIGARRATLAAALLATCSGCGGADQEAGAWEFKVDTVASAGGGSVHRTSWLRVVGREGADAEPRTRAVILSFDCLPDDASSRIMTEQSLRQGSVESRLTLDGDPPLRVPGFSGTTPSGGQVVLTIPQDSLLAALGGHQRAMIEYADGAGSSRTTAEFLLAGLETYRERFLASCAGRRR